MKFFFIFVGMVSAFYLPFVSSHLKYSDSDSDALEQCENTYLGETDKSDIKITSLLNQVRELSKYTTKNLLEQESPETLKLLSRRLFSKEGVEWEKAKRNVLYAFGEMRPEDPEFRQILSDVVSSENTLARIKRNAISVLRKILKPDDTKIYQDLIDVFLSEKTPHRLKQAIAFTFGEGKPRNPGIRRILLDILSSGTEDSWINRVLAVSIEKITKAYPDIYQDSADILLFAKDTGFNMEVEFLKMEGKLEELEELEEKHKIQIAELRKIASVLHIEYRNQKPTDYPIGTEQYKKVRNLEIAFNEIKEKIKLTERRIQNLMFEIQNFNNRVPEFKGQEKLL